LAQLYPWAWRSRQISGAMIDNLTLLLVVLGDGLHQVQFNGAKGGFRHVVMGSSSGIWQVCAI